MWSSNGHWKANYILRSNRFFLSVSSLKTHAAYDFTVKSYLWRSILTKTHKWSMFDILNKQLVLCFTHKLCLPQYPYWKLTIGQNCNAKQRNYFIFSLHKITPKWKLTDVLECPDILIKICVKTKLPNGPFHSFLQQFVQISSSLKTDSSKPLHDWKPFIGSGNLMLNIKFSNCSKNYPNVWATLPYGAY